MRFTKVHGLGNDFVLLDGTVGRQPDYAAIAPWVCHRQTGVGADGILVVLRSDKADVRMRIFNSDGSEPEMCGNGIRAFSKYVYENHIVHAERFSVETLAGIMHPELIVEDGLVAAVRVDMGEPFVHSEQVPVLGDGLCVDRELNVLGRTLRYTSVRVGVPHTIVYEEEPQQYDLRTFGCAVEHADVFPQRTNVDFVYVVDDHTISMRTWERGCGPTLACGTGACSAVVAGALGGKHGREADVCIELGKLHIEWAQDNHVYMTGPAETVFTGELPDERLF